LTKWSAGEDAGCCDSEPGHEKLTFQPFLATVPEFAGAWAEIRWAWDSGKLGESETVSLVLEEGTLGAVAGAGDGCVVGRRGVV
jgi:hypothetical protein